MAKIQLTLLDTKNKDKSFHHSADTYKGLQALHKYWSKKPGNVVRHFLFKYSQKGDIVLDPFCGSGTAIVESLLAKRKAIGIDINPAAIFITRQTISPVDVNRIEKACHDLRQTVAPRIHALYKVVRDEGVFTGTHFIWKDGTLMEVWYEKNGKRVTESPSETDIALATSFSREMIPYFYPTEKLFHNPRINANKGSRVDQLFTSRNLLALSMLWHALNQVPDETVREFFKFCFTASLGQASKMVFVVKRRGKFGGKARRTSRKKEVGSWVIGYWQPKEHFEINVWNCFEHRYKRILKAKKKMMAEMDLTVKEGRTIQQVLASEYNLLLFKKPAQDVLKEFPDNSIDYVITDPPHGDRQPYLELSVMWNSWLGEHPEYDKELVISDSKERDKDKEHYFHLLKEVFQEIERVLKHDRYFTVMFNSLDDEIWINLFSIMNELHFTLSTIETFEYSAGSVVQDTRAGGLKSDFILTFKKVPSDDRIKKTIMVTSMMQEKDLVIDLIETFIRERNILGRPTYQIINYLTIFFLKQGKIFKLSELQQLLRSHFKREGNVWVGRR